MWPKVLLGALFVLSVLGAFVLAPAPKPAGTVIAVNQHQLQNGRHLRLITWNIGNGDLEAETRAHVEDLPAVARVIEDNYPDAVALQELTGEDQLKLLMDQLENCYRGYVCSSGSADRVDAVLVRNSGGPKDPGAGSRLNAHQNQKVRFNDVVAGNRFAAAATFRLRDDSAEFVLVSAHADAFRASRRRTFVAEVVDWARSRGNGQFVFVAGDFNLEVSIRNKTELFTDDAKHDSESYAYLLKYFRDLGSEAGETSINDRRIDYIFGPTKTVTVRRAEVLRGAAVGRMDHWPLLVEVEL
jgi:endonuclease/exonuclease/phosphatase family metal-dependent hydrolase